MSLQTFPIAIVLAVCFVLFGTSNGGGRQELKCKIKEKVNRIAQKVNEKVDRIAEKVNEKLGLTDCEKELGPGGVRNWMNSFLHAKIRYGQIQSAESGERKMQEFNVIFDSVYNLAQNPMNFLLDNCPEKNAQNEQTACKKHKMEIYKSQSARIVTNGQSEVTTIDGVKLNMKIVEDRMEYGGVVVENAKLMLLDGADFKLFSPILDSGAPGGPRMDGVFSLALGSQEFPSGMEELLKDKAEKIATVYMQPFGDLDFYSKTTANISIGQLNRLNCDFAGQPEWVNIVDERPRKWKVGMEVNVKNANNVKRLDNQQVLISTMDSFIFAPKSVTAPIMDHVTLVQDNKIFQNQRNLGKSGLEPKDVLIECPKQKEWDKLPTFEFKFGTRTFTLTPKEYILKIKVPLNPVKDTHKIGVLNWCHMMIRKRPESGMYAKYVMEEDAGQWMVGQLFFNKACVAFKYGETPQMAMAPPTANANANLSH